MQMFRVYGEMTIPVYLSTYAHNKNEALQYAFQTMNSNNIDLIEGDVYTTDNKEHFLLATYSTVKWIEALSKDDI